MAEPSTADPDARAAGDGRRAHLRERGERAGEVRPIELFVDLVYVLAVTQLTRHLVANLTLRGALQTLILLLAVCGAWNHIAWITNYFDLGARASLSFRLRSCPRWYCSRLRRPWSPLRHGGVRERRLWRSTARQPETGSPGQHSLTAAAF